MGRVLIIGAGGVGNVVVRKCAAMPHVFSHIVLANRTLKKAEAIQRALVPQANIQTERVDADNTQEVVELIRKVQPDLLVHVALPYQDLSLMEACLSTQTHYLDTANYEPRGEARFSYEWQWAYHDRFKEKGLMALLGCGFDPGVTNAFTAYASRYLLDEMHTLDILDCNGGDHGQAFATNFNPEINIREITGKGRYFQNGTWQEFPALSLSQEFDFPEVGRRRMYLMFHEELDSLVKHFPQLQRARFWMTFGESYIQHLQVLQNIGLTRIDPVLHKGQEVIPLEFLKTLLPDPGTLGKNYVGKTCIGNIICGKKEGQPKNIYIYNICDHAQCFEEVQAQAVSYTTGVPAAVGAKMILTDTWKKPGVFCVEQLDPQPFLNEIRHQGLTWQVMEAPPMPDAKDWGQKAKSAKISSLSEQELA